MRYRPLAIGALIASLALVTVASLRQSPLTVAPRQGFEESTDGWMPFGSAGTLRVTRERANVKQGNGALELGYTASSTSFGSAVLPLNQDSLADLRRLRFWIKTDTDTAIGVVLSEKPDGGAYTAWFWSSKDEWQHVELGPADFVLNEGSTDPPDPNQRLDLDRLQGLGIIDLGQFYGSLSKDPKYPVFITPVTGTHYLHVDDLEILTDVPPLVAPPTLIGDPARGLVTWMTLGGARLGVGAPAGAAERPAFRAEYDQQPDKLVVLAHGLRSLDLDAVDGLAFSLASTRPATIAALLEERSAGKDYGPRYAATLDVPGGSTAVRRTVRFSEFVFDATSPADPDGQLTLSQLKTLALIDLTAATSPARGRNTLWIGAVEGTAR